MPSTPRVRTPKVLSSARVIQVTMGTLTSCVKVKLLLHGGEEMAWIDESKSSHKTCNPCNLVCKICIQVIKLCSFLSRIRIYG